jgi:hypothetical protein
MKRRIKRISPLQAGKMLGVLYTGFGLLFLPFFAIAAIGGACGHRLIGGCSGARRRHSSPDEPFVPSFLWSDGIHLRSDYGGNLQPRRTMEWK